VLETLGLMAFITASFRLAGVRRTRLAVNKWAGDRRPHPEPGTAIDRIRAARRSLAMVRRATGMAGTCLSRSFALWTLLRRRGVETELQIGYRKRGDQFEGHAWLEYQGDPINEHPAEIATYTIAAGSGKIRWT
jgi:Transglutaminase-like superfamily